MKKSTILITLILLCAATLFAQAPEKFTYQAVVRNANNSLMANAQVGVRVSILQGNANGNAVYVETHNANTNTNGLLTVEIGGGNIQQGTFADIDWANGPFFLKTETDPNGGTNYSITSTQQLLSVPYALYAKNAGNGFSGDYNDLTNTPIIPAVPTNISAFTNDAGYLTNYTETDPQYNAWDKDYNDLINKPTIPTVPMNVSAFTNDAGYITMDSVPTIPTNVSAFTNDAGYITSYTETDPQYNAWDKDYNDLINKPTIPTVPANVSAFTNDAGYITMDSIPTIPTVPTNVSAFTNDAGYITGYTETDPQFNAWDKDYNDLINKPIIPTVPTNVSAFTNDAGYLTSYTESDPQFNAWDKDYNDLINKPTIPTIPENVSAFNNDVPYLTVEQQILSISNDTIFLTGGSFVKLPAGFSGDYNDLTNKPEIPTVPTNVSTFTNDAGYLTAEQCGGVDICALANLVSSLQDQISALQLAMDSIAAPDTTNSVTSLTVTTNVATNVTKNTVSLNGTVSNPNNVTIISQGFSWKIATAADYIAVPASGETMTYSLTGLTAGTMYMYRAFVITAEGTSYGETMTFWTLSADGQPCAGMATVTDHQGNVYNTVQIGDQCWTKENMRCTTSPKGYLTAGADTVVSNNVAYYYNNTASDIPLGTRGLLYNWAGAMDTTTTTDIALSFTNRRGICPEGWHVPSSMEWTLLIDYVRGQGEYQCDNNQSYIAKSLASTTYWELSSNNCAVGNTPSDNNATGFSAVPAGTKWLFPAEANFWSSTSRGLEGKYYWMEHSSPLFSDYEVSKYVALPVRCLRDKPNSISYAMVVATSNATDVAQTTATLNGIVSVPDNVTIIEKGFEWKEAYYRYHSTYTTVNVLGETMQYDLTGLTANRSYTYRAFVTTSEGTIYGEDRVFTTQASTVANDGQPCSGTATATDHEGNVYNTVQIGTQCWTKENMRCVTSPHGYLSAGGNDTSSTIAYYYNDTSSVIPLEARGLLYNWAGAMDITVTNGITVPLINRRGICPEGWHVPSLDEYQTLINYVKNQSEYQCDSYNGNGGNAKALASTNYWNNNNNEEGCTPQNTPLSNNVTGFSAVPAGWYGQQDLSFNNSGYNAFFLSSTSNIINIHYIGSSVYYQGMSKRIGCSIRCLLNDSTPSVIPPTVTTAAATSINETSAVLNATITNPDFVNITKGFEWKATDSIAYTQVVGIGLDNAFTANLSNLSASTNYTYRAFITYNGHTEYGQESTFTTLSSGNNSPCPGVSTVSDYDGNLYNTVQVGDQCWMKENLRTTHYADGTPISLGNGTSTTVGYYYTPSISSYGYFYNWMAVMHNTSSSQANPNVVQGICPNGWHVPSDAEWTELTDFVSNQSEYVCDDNTSYIAKALASTIGWSPTSNGTCFVGNNQGTNNATGFGALPTGCYNNDYDYDGYYSSGGGAFFWSATEVSIGSAWCRALYYNDANVNRNASYKGYGYSVRCLRD